MTTHLDPRELQRKIDQLERELETPISPERRRAVMDAIFHLKEKERDSRWLLG